MVHCTSFRIYLFYNIHYYYIYYNLAYNSLLVYIDYNLVYNTTKKKEKSVSRTSALDINFKDIFLIYFIHIFIRIFNLAIRIAN